MYNAMNFKSYSKIVNLMRDYFLKRGFFEVPAQSNLSILAAWLVKIQGLSDSLFLQE